MAVGDTTAAYFLVYVCNPNVAGMQRDEGAGWLRNRWFLTFFLQIQVGKTSRVRFNYTTILPRPGLALVML